PTPPLFPYTTLFRSTGVGVTVGLMGLTVILLTSLMATLYRKAGPHEALVVYGFRGTRVVKGHGTIIFPMIEACRQLSLELMSFEDRKSTRLNSSHQI